MNRSSARGFTLLEILVAVFVFAIFSAMAYGGLSRLLENRARIDEERAFWREIALGFVRMEQDFSLARNRPVRNSGGNPVEAFRGQPTDTRAVADPSVEFSRGGIVVPNGYTADTQRVGYRLVDDNLVRVTWPVLDRAPQTQPAMTPLLHNVEEFQVRFFQASQQSGTSSGGLSGTWIQHWPPLGSTQHNPLPEAVEVTVALKGRGKYTRVFLVGKDI